jgi:hypothetical protein
MKKTKDNKLNTNNIQKKIGRQLKEIIPPTITKNIRDNIPIKPVDTTNNFRDYSPYVTPNSIFPEWPNDEELKVKYILFYNLHIDLQSKYR